MKIVFVLANGYMYGDNKALYNLMPYFLEKGIDCLLLIPQSSDADKTFRKIIPHIINYDDIGFYPVYFHKIISSESRIRNLWSRFKFLIKYIKSSKCEFQYIKKKISEFSPDLIHTNNSGSVLGYKLAKALNVKHIWHLREYGDLDANWLYVPSKKAIIRKLRDPINHNIAITNAIKKHFHLGNNTEVIYDGPLKAKSIPVISDKESYMLYVGRLFPQKGVELLLDAIEDVVLHIPNILLLFAGTGEKEYVDYLHQKIQTKGLNRNVVFLGYRTDIPELMAKATAVIVPSESEAFGFITAEAMFYGTEVIGRNTAGTKEQMDNIENLYNSKVCRRFYNQKDLAHNMIEVWRNEPDKSKLTKISDITLYLYSAEISAKHVFNYYNKILSK